MVNLSFDYLIVANVGTVDDPIKQYAGNTYSTYDPNGGS